MVVVYVPLSTISTGTGMHLETEGNQHHDDAMLDGRFSLFEGARPDLTCDLVLMHDEGDSIPSINAIIQH